MTRTRTVPDLRAAAWAVLTAGAALGFLRQWSASGALQCLRDPGPHPHADRYALPVAAATRDPHPNRSRAMEPTTIATPDRVRLLVAALHYAGYGWHVFPLIPDAKRPAVTKWEDRATIDPERIERCWSTGSYGIGIAAGPSRLVVLDLDQPKTGTPPPPTDAAGVRDGADMFTAVCADAGHPVPWDTYTVATGRGGTHLYLTAPDSTPALRNTAGALGWLIDTRAAGGYVVAPPSTVDGRPYEVVGGHLAALPDWLAHRLTPVPLPAQRPVRVPLLGSGDARRDAYLAAAVRRQVETVTAAAEGTRNRALYLSAVALGQLVAGSGLPEATVITTLAQAGANAGLTAHEVSRTIASGMSAGARRPRTLDASREAA